MSDSAIEALRLYQKAFEHLFASCLSNGIYNAWQQPVDCTDLNLAHSAASKVLRELEAVDTPVEDNDASHARPGADTTVDLVSPAAPAPFGEITQEMMLAGEAYIDSLGFRTMRAIPATFRWTELWSALISAAPAAPAPEPSTTIISEEDETTLVRNENGKAIPWVEDDRTATLYQVIGNLADHANVFDDPAVIRALDLASYGVTSDSEDVLPFLPAYPSKANEPSTPTAGSQPPVAAVGVNDSAAPATGTLSQVQAAPLTWEKSDSGWLSAETAFGRYEIEPVGERFMLWVRGKGLQDAPTFDRSEQAQNHAWSIMNGQVLDALGVKPQ